MPSSHDPRLNALDRPIRVITFTTLFPNTKQPTHGIFVENRLRHLVAGGHVTSRVVAPVPWFPSALLPLFPAYAGYVGVPFAEQRHDLRIIHPRFLTVPRAGMAIAPALLFARSFPILRRMRIDGGDFDLIDAHYFYPDGVAAVMLGNAMRKPVVITARGTDVNFIPRARLPRLMIQYAAHRAAGIIAVSQALKDGLVGLGIPESKVRVLRNGVDLEMFRALDRSDARAKLGLRGPTLLSVGHLIERKGHDLVIGALAVLPQVSLLIVGEGPERPALERLAATLGVKDRVKLLGHVSHELLASIYSAADVLVLASSREGWPNVLLEAMACGTPVVASNIWGNPEVVTRPEAGELMLERTVDGVAAAVDKILKSPRDRAATRRYAENFSWDDTTQGQIRLFSEILANSPASLAS
jgi:teichuronic acid biosynthesis glycosyltransferase TuaC